MTCRKYQRYSIWYITQGKIVSCVYFCIVVVQRGVISISAHRNVRKNPEEEYCTKMKIYVFAALLVFVAITTAVFVPPRPGNKKLLGSEECTRGPTYWCQNLTAASSCQAVKHCIQTVWVHQKLPLDNSSVCQVCLDMVKQARDQLESNETQELIKEVFEGSCALLHLKPVVEECDKIADDYIPDLIDTLASEMNPQVVCSVAGLCNNAKVHKLLEEAGEEINVPSSLLKRDTCQDCHTVVDIIEDKFSKKSRDQILQGFLQFCGKMGSFSDGCSNIIVTYFKEIYSHLQEHLNSNEVCLMSGECSAQFHKHPTKVEITPMSHIGYVLPDQKADDELPCDLCEQLVTHLRQLLVANTTELEFKKVLDGLCKQSGKFANECISLVDQYYAETYNFLVHELQPVSLCTMIGICQPAKPKKVPAYLTPLLPPKTAKLALSLSEPEKKPLVHVPLHSDKSAVKILPPGLNTQPQQLPIDLLMPPHTQILYNKQVCQFCQYFLHFVQVEMTEPKNEEQIRKVIDEACSKLPNTINQTCTEFVDTYEPALVALLVQQIDPSQVCPLIRACPASNNRDVEVFMQAKEDSKCPMCLFAVTKLESMVKDKKSKDDIKNALNRLCVELPNEMMDECEDFVQTYTDELVEMLIADLKPEEVCVFLKLCSAEGSAHLPPLVISHFEGNIETNIIPDNTINGQIVGLKRDSLEEGPQCVLCEFIMKEIDDQLKDNKTDEEIENVVRSVCKVMPKSVNKQCTDFVNQYGDSVIQLLISALEPSEICAVIKLCNSQIDAVKAEILECPVCQLTVEAMEKILTNPNVDHSVEHVLEKTCRGLPGNYKDKCANIIEKHGDSMIEMLVHYTDKDFVCQKIGCCKSTLHEIVID